MVDTVATVGLLLLHTPPVVDVLNDVVNPTQSPVLPDIVAGPPFTVAIVVIWHPDGNT